MRREGKGTPLLLVHGYPTASWDWVEIWPSLVQRFDTIALDMLGFGFSEKPQGHRYSIFEQADLHMALLMRLGIEQFDLLVHDYGVTVGQELLARHADGQLPGLRSIAFLNGGLFPETHRARLIQKALASPIGPLLAQLSSRRTFARSMRAVFGPRTQPTEAQIDAFFELSSRDGGKLALAGLIRYIEERRLHRDRWVGAFVSSNVPMILVDGVLDPVSGGHMVARARELRPTLEIVELAVGHYPQVEDPEGVLTALHRFWDRTR